MRIKIVISSLAFCILILSGCQPDGEYTIEDIGKINRFSIKNNAKGMIDSPIKIEGISDGDGYIYLRGAERELLPPDNNGFSIKIHKGNNQKVQKRTIQSGSPLSFVYVPLTAKKGEIKVTVEFQRF